MSLSIPFDDDERVNYPPILLTTSSSLEIISSCMMYLMCQKTITGDFFLVME